MNDILLQRVNRIFDLERDYLERLLAQDPAFAELLGKVARTEAGLIRNLDPEQAQALKEAKRLLFEMSFEAAFKMGYLYAHTHPPDESDGLTG